MSQFTLLPAMDYIENATRAIHNAKDRVIVLSTVVADHDATHDFIDALILAAQRGVVVTVAADVFTYGEITGGFLPLRYYSKPGRNLTSLARLFREAGIHFRWLGRTRMTIFTGRTHGKWCIVDDTVYAFGGVNIYQEGVAENTDFMFKVRSHALAERLEVENKRVLDTDRSGRLQRSRQFDLNADHVLIDGGISGNSIIYHRACDLAASASTILFVSQYPPTGKLSNIFRTKQSTIYYNRPEQAEWLNRLVIHYGQWRSKFATLYKRDEYLHSKFIIFTMPDGSKVALTGSHNFSHAGVLLGTREIALETRDQAVIEQLESFVKEHVA